MAGKRHNFTVKTVDILGKRVGFLCSNPNCRRNTIGPNTEPDKATIVGVAAHITAASPGGPRYNPKMDVKDRKSIENGIWLCVNCSTLIDKDPGAFPVEVLNAWKDEAENSMSERLVGQVNQTPKEAKLAFLEVDLIWASNMRINRGYSEKNREIYGDKPIYAGSPIIIHWELRWEFSLVVYNNSTFTAYNIRIIPNQDSLSFEQLAKYNNLPALANMDIEVGYREAFEGTHIEADEILHHKIPQSVVGSSFKLVYTDDSRIEHSLIFTITEEGIENNPIS